MAILLCAQIRQSWYISWLMQQIWKEVQFFSGVLCVKVSQIRVVNIFKNTSAGTNCLQKVELFPRPPKHSKKMYDQQILILKKSRAGTYFFATNVEQLFDEDVVMFKKVGVLMASCAPKCSVITIKRHFWPGLKLVSELTSASLAILVQHGQRNQIEACLMREY